MLRLDGGAGAGRTVIARTLVGWGGRPDQWALLGDGADLAIAVGEFIRWVTRVHSMCRVATTDVEMHGHNIRAGDQLVLMYSSANRDPSHFDDPETFDVTRDPNHHIAFGFGTHFCLGAALARLEIRSFFEEFVARVAEIRSSPGTTPAEMPTSCVYGMSEAHLELMPAWPSSLPGRRLRRISQPVDGRARRHHPSLRETTRSRVRHAGPARRRR